METKLKPLYTDVNGTDKKNSSKNEELVKRKDIKDTPFEVITINDKSFGTMGQFRLTENLNSIKEVEKELKEITWNRLIQVIMILDELKSNLKTNKTSKK